MTTGEPKKRRWVEVAVAALWVVAAPVTGRADPAALPAKDREAFCGSEEDLLDKKVCEGTRKRVMLTCRDATSYVVMNEWYHELWRPYLEKAGGAYVGIASDQNFTLIAWQRAELAWMMDYDPLVVRVNQMHVAFIKASESIEVYLARFDKAEREKSQTLLRKEYEKHAELKEILAAHRGLANSIGAHLRKVRSVGKRRVSHWLHSAEDYAYLRALIQAGRLRVLKGDLLKDKTLAGIGKVSHQLKVPVRAIYLSNAEEFWPYPRTFRNNFIGLNMDDRTVVLRTRHSNKYGPKIGQYLYIVQGGKDFQKRLADAATHGLWNMMNARQPGRPGFFTIGIPVRPESKVAPQARGGEKEPADEGQ